MLYTLLNYWTICTVHTCCLDSFWLFMDINGTRVLLSAYHWNDTIYTYPVKNFRICWFQMDACGHTKYFHILLNYKSNWLSLKDSFIYRAYKIYVRCGTCCYCHLFGCKLHANKHTMYIDLIKNSSEWSQFSSTGPYGWKIS